MFLRTVFNRRAAEIAEEIVFSLATERLAREKLQPLRGIPIVPNKRYGEFFIFLGSRLIVGIPKERHLMEQGPKIRTNNQSTTGGHC